MHSLDLPAGLQIRLTATARPGTDLHRWDVRLLAAGKLEAGGSPRLAYGSRIGVRDLDQRIDIPPQDVGCRLEIRSRHTGHEGWQDDRCTVQEDTPNELRIGFCDAARLGALPDDVLLSFAFAPANRASSEETTMAKGQKRSNRETRKPKQQATPKTVAGPRSFLETASSGAKGSSQPIVGRKPTPR
jgi:hypothetical protein